MANTTKQGQKIVYFPKFEDAFLNCPMEFKCGVDWYKLDLTDRPDVRHCKTCDKNVHFCTDQTQLDAHAAVGNCVAFYEARLYERNERSAGMTVGVPKYLIH